MALWRADAMGGGLYLNDALANGCAIARTCEDVPRALMLIEVLHLDKQANDIVNLGVEGVNYTLDEQGLAFIDAGQKSFSLGSSCFVTANTTKRQMLWEGPYGALTDKAVPAPGEDFVLKRTQQMRDSMLEIESIVLEYNNQLLYGLVQDPLATLDEARQRMLQAGVTQYLAQLNVLWQAP